MRWRTYLNILSGAIANYRFHWATSKVVFIENLYTNMKQVMIFINNMLYKPYQRYFNVYFVNIKIVAECV